MKLNKPKSKPGCSKRKKQKYKRTREHLRKGFDDTGIAGKKAAEAGTKLKDTIAKMDKANKDAENSTLTFP